MDARLSDGSRVHAIPLTCTDDLPWPRTKFLLLGADLPLRLARAGEQAGPELQFWSRAGGFSGVLLFAGKWMPHHEGKGGFDDIEMVNGLAVSRADEFADWCVPKASMTVHVYQEPGGTFIDEVPDGLEIRNVDIAS